MAGRGRRRARTGTALALVSTLAGCAGDAGAVPAEQPAREAVERFVEFDDWARRTARGDHLFPSEGAFRETLFAPVRRDDGVFDACVERRGRTTETWCLRGEPPPIDADWTALRNAPRARVRTRRDRKGGEGRWVLERREEVEGVELRVTMVVGEDE